MNHKYGIVLDCQLCASTMRMMMETTLEFVKKALREAGCSAGIWSLYSVNRKFWLGFDIVGVLGRERRTPLSSAWRVCISTRAKAT